MIRKIVEINEELCNGCGACANACLEAAIIMVDGKAKLIKDDYCDGLGNCLPGCPVNAIKIIEREAAEFDEEAVKERVAVLEAEQKKESAPAPAVHGGCPGSMARQIRQESAPVSPAQAAPASLTSQESQLRQWPVQIKLVPVKAAYFDQANLLIAADCTAYAYAGFHQDYIKNHITVIGCPKLDEGSYAEKLTEILKQNEIKSVKIVRMEVPCCGGIERAAVDALKNCGKMIPWQVDVISCDGKVLER